MTQRWAQYPRNLTGANCKLGDQTIISLLATESVDSDYDTASAITIAPGGPFQKGQTIRTYEGGVDTGGWVVEDGSRELDGSRTWRSKAGAPFTNVPMVSYKLRRQGYLAARSTLSETRIGQGAYPPQFCTADYMRDTILGDGATPGLRKDLADGKIDNAELYKRQSSWIVVQFAWQIVQKICTWVGLTFNLQVDLPGCATNYSPADKPALTAIKEIAAWSGASCWLDHNGVLQIFGWDQAFTGACPARPGYVLQSETHQNLFSPTHVTVVGTMQGVVWWGGAPAHWAYDHSGYGDPRLKPMVWVPKGPGQWVNVGTPEPCSVTVGLQGPECAYPVNERIQIREYNINQILAAGVAKERLAYVHIMANASKWSGPGEGCQNLHPLTQNIIAVTRRLDWTGTYYKYSLDITGATARPTFGDTSDWWTTTQ